MSDAPPPSEPHDTDRKDVDTLPTSDTRNDDIARWLELRDELQTRVGQAQAQIAKASGQANDATTRIEELAAAATTSEEKQLVSVFATINQEQKALTKDIADTLPAIVAAVEGLRADQAQSGKSTTSWNRLFLLIAILGIIVAVLAWVRPA
jgi:hypothetical protein